MHSRVVMHCVTYARYCLTCIDKMLLRELGALQLQYKVTSMRVAVDSLSARPNLFHCLSPPFSDT